MTGSLTGSLTGSASYALNALSSSYAITSSYAIAGFDTVPIGTIMAFANDVAPNNWSECNGTAFLHLHFHHYIREIQTTSSTAVFGYLCDKLRKFQWSRSLFQDTRLTRRIFKRMGS